MSTTHPPVLAVRPDERPEIICPDWCTASYDHHLAELGELDGFVIHGSAPRHGVFHTRCAYPDNVADPKEPPMIYIEGVGGGVTIERARELLRDLAAVVKEAQS